MQSQDILSALEKTGALLNGHFELRSKLHSNRFFQCAILQRHPRVFAQLCGELAKRVAAAAIHADYVIAPALGGIVAGHEVARHLDTLSIFAEKENDRLTMRRFSITAGKRYLVVEDVITRGGRVDETIALVRQGGGQVTGVAVLVDRSAGQATFGVPLITLLEMAPEVWEPAQCPLCRQGLPLVHPGS